MAYRFKHDSSIEANVHRVVREQIETATHALTSGEDLHAGIHDARKCFKKVRAVVRLVRPGLGDVYQQENRRFRDAGRTLSLVRDAEAMIETVDQLCDEQREQTNVEGFAPLRAALVARREELAGQQGELEERVASVLHELETAQQAITDWPALADEFATLAGGLKRSYKRGRNAMQRAYAQPDTDTFHEWRKRVKYHWYHARLLRNVWRPLLQSYGAELKYLSKLLGDNHDLAVLHATLDAKPGLLGNKRNRTKLRKLTQQQQERLRNEAWYLGRRIYAPRPKVLTHNLKQYWVTWQT